MDITTTIIGLVMLGIFIVPVAIVSSRNKNNNNALLTELNYFATQNNCEISEHNINSQFAIGISTSGDKVFFIRKQGSDQDLFKSLVPLKQIKQCVLKTQNRTVKLKKNTENVIDKIEIRFQSKLKEINELSWLFYDSTISTEVINEYQLATNWISRINKHI